MGIKPLPTKVFIQFLKTKRIVHIRTHASHDIFDNPQNPL